MLDVSKRTKSRKAACEAGIREIVQRRADQEALIRDLNNDLEQEGDRMAQEERESLRQMARHHATRVRELASGSLKYTWEKSSWKQRIRIQAGVPYALPWIFKCGPVILCRELPDGPHALVETVQEREEQACADFVVVLFTDSHAKYWRPDGETFGRFPLPDAFGGDCISAVAWSGGIVYRTNKNPHTLHFWNHSAWTKLPPTTAGVVHVTAANDSDGKLYVVGGTGRDLLFSHTVERFDGKRWKVVGGFLEAASATVIATVTAHRFLWCHFRIHGQDRFWRLDLETQKATQLPMPSISTGNSCWLAASETEGEVYTFQENAVWQYNPLDVTWYTYRTQQHDSLDHIPGKRNYAVDRHSACVYTWIGEHFTKTPIGEHFTKTPLHLKPPTKFQRGVVLPLACQPEETSTFGDLTVCQPEAQGEEEEKKRVTGVEKGNGEGAEKEAEEEAEEEEEKCTEKENQEQDIEKAEKPREGAEEEKERAVQEDSGPEKEEEGEDEELVERWARYFAREKKMEKKEKKREEQAESFRLWDRY